MTVNNNSSFILDTDFAYAETFGIDNSGNASGGYIDLVGTGTIKVLTAAGSSNGFGAEIAGTIIGNGGTTPVTSEVVGDYLVYSTVPAASTVEITSIAVLGNGDVVLTTDVPAAGLTAQQSEDLLTSFTDVASTVTDTNELTIASGLVDTNADGADFFRVRN